MNFSQELKKKLSHPVTSKEPHKIVQILMRHSVIQCENVAVTTVKLDFKELLNKEQIDFKELFTDYQRFYTINLLLNKELLPM